MDVPPSAFDLAVIFAAMYSPIPTRKRRVNFLKRLKVALKPGGYFLCQYSFEPALKTVAAVEAVKKAVACITLGYLEYEKGDVLSGAGGSLYMFSLQKKNSIRNLPWPVLRSSTCNYPNPGEWRY